jgi:hypothetical protein
VDAGDVLGVFVEGILGERGHTPPIINFAPDQASGARLAPAIGFPVPVQENGMLTLPLLNPLRTRGYGVSNVQDLIRDSYVNLGLVAPGTRVFVTLAKPRTYRVTVVRQDPAAGRRPTITALELPAYENDVLTALSRVGTLPGPDAAVVIQRGGAVAGAAGVQQVRIPMRVRPDQPLPFKPDDVVLRTGDVVLIEGGDEPAPTRGPTAEPDRSPLPAVALTLAVAAPDGRILVQLPGGAWKLFDAAKVTATETDGRPVAAAAVAERLKAMTAVLVAAAGRPPAGQYLQLVKPGALVLVLKE